MGAQHGLNGSSEQGHLGEQTPTCGVVLRLSWALRDIVVTNYPLGTKTREKGKLWDIVCGKKDPSAKVSDWKIHFTFSWLRYFGKGTFTFGESPCHQWPVPGCAGASWALPARRERKKLIIFMGSLKANRVLSQPRNKTNPSSATYAISNLEIHNNDKKPGNLLIIQHEVERKYQSYKNNTQSKRGKFSLPSWVSLIPEMVLGRAPASRILFCNQNLSRLNEEISSLHSPCSSSTSLVWQRWSWESPHP